MMRGDSLMNRLREWSTGPASLPGFTGKCAIAGQRPPVRFIASEDHDGQIEVSLSLAGPRKPTDAHCAAFWRALDHEPIEEAPNTRVHRHFVAVAAS